jgi:hypothetical protein
MFRFTIRDLLWLTVVVGICCAWAVHHAAWQTWFSREALSWLKSNVDQGQRIIDLTVQNIALTNENEELRAKSEQPATSK